MIITVENQMNYSNYCVFLIVSPSGTMVNRRKPLMKCSVCRFIHAFCRVLVIFRSRNAGQCHEESWRRFQKTWENKRRLGVSNSTNSFFDRCRLCFCWFYRRRLWFRFLFCWFFLSHKYSPRSSDAIYYFWRGRIISFV